MKTTHPLTDEQEAMRLQGLRALARIIARHALARSVRDANAAAECLADGEALPAGKDGAA